MSRDKTEVPHTCPLINVVISAIESVDWEDKPYYTENSLIETMEQIRGMNEKLREVANEFIDKADELEDEIFRLENEILELNKSLKQCKNEDN